MDKYDLLKYRFLMKSDKMNFVVWEFNACIQYDLAKFTTIPSPPNSTKSYSLVFVLNFIFSVVWLVLSEFVFRAIFSTKNNLSDASLWEVKKKTPDHASLATIDCQLLLRSSGTLPIPCCYAGIWVGFTLHKCARSHSSRERNRIALEQ